MDLGIKDRVAMVAAASKGIGKGIAASLAGEGCRVSICARNLSELEITRDELTSKTGNQHIIAIACDVSKAQDLREWHRQTVEKLGAVDILVTNTGGPPPGKFENLSENDWQKGVESTLMNVIRLSKMVLPGMQKRKRGRIVHITSLAAKQPIDILSISNSLRAGISALTKTLSTEYAKYNICINAVLPGHILTERQRELNTAKSKDLNIPVEEYTGRVLKEIPAGRHGTPQEIGDVVAFLCSEQASYLSGTSIQVDGGVIKSTF